MHTLANYIRQTGAEVMLNMHTYRERERERERDRQTERKTDRLRERDRQTEGGRGEQRTNRQREGEDLKRETDRKNQRVGEMGRDKLSTYPHTNTVQHTHSHMLQTLTCT